MLKINNKSISSVYDETTSIGKIMKGTLKVYEAFKRLIASGVPPITLLKCKGYNSALPLEYQEVEYIESTGEQYIDTGVVVSSNLNISSTLLFTKLPTSVDSGVCPYGAFETDNNIFWRCCSGEVDVNPSAIGYGTHQKTIQAYLNTEEKITLGNNGGNFFYIDKDGKKITDSLVASDFLGTRNIYIFAQTGASASRYSKMRLYKFTIDDGTNKLRHFIPCYRKSDKVIGLYDLVENKFYENAGTGIFLKGGNKLEGISLIDYKIYGNSVQKLLPSEYQEVEYIESTGGQYIDTGFMPNQDSSVEIYGHQIYREANSLFGVNPYFVITSGSGFYRFRYNNTAIDTTITSSTLVKIALKKNEAYINDELIGTFEVGEFQTTYNALLFGRVSSSGSPEETKASRIYYAKIWDNDVLVRHFIPCYRKSDNVVGMYDLIDKTFYGNVGTGDFLKGNDTSSLPTPDTPIEVESVGNKSKNLFPEEMLLVNSLITKTDEGYVNSGYPASYSITNKGVDLIKHLKKVIKPNVTYTLSRKVSNYKSSSSGAIAIRSSSGALVSVREGNGIKSVTFSLTQEQIDSIYNMYVYGLGENPTIFEYIQLEEGDKVTDYEPYGYRIPVEVTPNIYNYEEFFSVAGTAQSIAVSKINFDSINIYQRYQNIFVIPNTLFKPNTTYEISKTLKVISGTSQYNTSRIAIATSQTSGAFYLIEGNKSTATFTTPADLTNYTYLWIYGIADGEIEINDIFIREVGLESVTTDIYLNEPLRKITGYDTDYIDFENKKIVRNVYQLNLSDMAFTNFNTSAPLSNGMYRSGYFNIIDTKKYMVRGGTAVKGYCNALPTNNGSWTVPNSETIRFGQSNGMFYIYTNNVYESKEAMLEYLGKNAYVVYPLATPIEEEIELPNIPTFKGTTIIEIDTSITPSNMEVIYIGKK